MCVCVCVRVCTFTACVYILCIYICFLQYIHVCVCVCVRVLCVCLCVKTRDKRYFFCLTEHIVMFFDLKSHHSCSVAQNMSTQTKWFILHFLCKKKERKKTKVSNKVYIFVYLQVRNVPANVNISCEWIAQIKKISMEEVKEITTQNAVKLFPALAKFVRR